MKTKLIKGKATKVYSINREKLKEAIKILDDVSSEYKSMLKKTGKKEGK